MIDLIWKDHKLPNHGWKVYRMLDLGQQVHLCEFCKNQKCRYVFEMHHEDLAEDFFLAVGVDCARKLVEIKVNGKRHVHISDLSDIDELYKRLDNPRYGKISNITDIKNWEESKKGNPCIYLIGFTITCFPATNHPERFSFCIYDHIEKKRIYSQKAYQSVEEAAEVIQKRLVAIQAERLDKSRRGSHELAKDK